MEESRPPFLQMHCDVDDVRLLHDAISYYLDNWPENDPDPVNPEAKIQHIKAFKKTLYSMLLEYNFHQG